MTQDTNIRQFPGAEIPEQTLSVEKKHLGFCQHEKITLDSHNRTVRCVACDQVFDPFNFLLNEVARLQDAWERNKMVRQDLNDLNDRVDALKKEEARLKGRIKTAKAKVEPAFSVRSREL
ncbi:hypothetical protein [Comamonas squillarum]|uniref:Uncharacterized protein n=1 Tax=Comamonas squillarum TaxID=2977320 RepID=A0ABY6A1B9_9BURK|nr:hypothetical protein [Comamonas sp. PR12]UXC20065.1 hypothetical protein N4T19_08135 [Comamonas sp. PR12]